jgi:phenylpyruvate tautomerase PptA (4-oxalocrotonate tautomerase family)
MPFVQISLGSQHSDETKTQISGSIHRALMEAFHIPADDYFQVFRSVPIQDLKFPHAYMGVDHTQDIIYVEIIARSGRTPDQKKKLYHLIATEIAANTPVRASDVIIVLVENTVENWSFGNGIAQYL